MKFLEISGAVRQL